MMLSKEKFGNPTLLVFHSAYWAIKVKYGPARGEDALSKKRKPPV
ncbi:hypothetical protein AVEN_146361-1, partial [Araneus ventricosus]